MTWHLTMYVADSRRVAVVSEKLRQLRRNTSAPPPGVHDYVHQEGVDGAIRDDATGADETTFIVSRGSAPRAVKRDPECLYVHHGISEPLIGHECHVALERRHAQSELDRVGGSPTMSRCN
jgi:hypothetical protein